MTDKNLIIDLDQIDMNRVIADLDEIRKYNPQRHEMEQLTAIVYDDPENHICVGYKDLREDEFWVRGHMPGMPLMPGVVMLEAAAQMSSYYVQRHNLLQAELVGFGGLEDVRFRGVVLPGKRLILLGQLLKCRPKRMIVNRFQGLVDGNIVVEGTLKGIALPIDAINDLQRGSG